MFRYSMALVAVFVLSAAVQAENIRGVVKSVDSNKTITMVVGNKEMTFDLTENCRVLGYVAEGRRGRRTAMVQLNGGLNAVQTNNQVLVTTVTRDGQEVVNQIQVEGMTYNSGGRRLLRR